MDFPSKKQYNNIMLLETDVSFRIPIQWLEQVKAAKKIAGWATWLINDPRVKVLSESEKLRRLAHARINRQIPDAPERFSGPVEPMTEPPWERPRTPYVHALLESWFENKRTIPITRLVRPLGQSLGWRTDAIMNVDGSGLMDWVGMQEGYTFHRTEEGWYAKTNYGNPEVRLIFPWVAAENDAVDAAEMAVLDRRAAERRAKRKAKRKAAAVGTVEPVAVVPPAAEEINWNFTDLPTLASYRHAPDEG